MPTLVQRLRDEARPKGTGYYRDELWHEAADEIERLEAIIREMDSFGLRLDQALVIHPEPKD